MTQSMNHFLNNKFMSELRPWFQRIQRDYLSRYPKQASAEKIYVGKETRINKRTVLRIFNTFYQSVFFQQCVYEGLPPAFKKLFYSLVWECPLQTIVEAMDRFKVPDINLGYYATRDHEINDSDWFYFFFHLGYTYHLTSYLEGSYVFLPKEVIDIARTWMEKPEFGVLKPQSRQEKNTWTYSGSSPETFYQLASLEHQGVLHRKQNGGIRTTVARNIQKKLMIPEFYQEKQHALIATELLSFMIKQTHSNTLNDYQTNPAELLKHQLPGWLNGCDSALVRWFFPWLQLGGRVYYSSQMKASLLFEFLKNLDLDSWYELDSLHRYIYTRDLFWGPDPDTFLNSNVRIKSSIPQEKDYFFRSLCTFRNTIQRLYVQRTFLLCAALGLINLVFEDRDKVNSPYTVPWMPGQDIIQIRLTELGAYVTGKTAEYSCEMASSGNINLDEDRLMMTLEGDNPCLKIALEAFAMPLSKTRYQLVPEQFTKDLDQDMLIGKIKQFKNLLPRENTFPDVWTSFFEEILNRKGALERVWDFVVLKVHPNRELMHLLAEDPYLNELVLKAEDYHLLVKSKDLDIVENHLKSFGFDISSSRRKSRTVSPFST